MSDQSSVPAISGERPRRAVNPITIASSGAKTAGAGPSCDTAGSVLTAAAIAPKTGPKKIAIGSESVRPSSNGSTAPDGRVLTASPATPQTTAAAARRDSTRSMAGTPLYTSFLHAGSDRGRRSRDGRDPRADAPPLESRDDTCGRRCAGMGSAAECDGAGARDPGLDDAGAGWA